MRPGWVARHRKTLTVAGLGLLQLAAYVVADPLDVAERPDDELPFLWRQVTGWKRHWS